MHLLRRNQDGAFSLELFKNKDIPPYAILSHTWGSDEVTFSDLVSTRRTDKEKSGYMKIWFCGEQAAKDGLQYFWVDTCCINKESSIELSEAINSMFRWYRDAAKCYVYLADVSISSSNELSHSAWDLAFRNSRWFTRGWTLIELLAPVSVEFFSDEGILLGNKVSLERQIHEVTGIPTIALRGGMFSFTVEERLSWAKNRKTSRSEDKAYSLLGLFNVFMPLIYGEGGKRAYNRLRRELEKSSYGAKSNTLSVASSTVPFRRDPDFIDRGSILHQIDESCAVPGSMTALVGLGGIGKSQLAIEFAYRLRDQSPETWVFWVHASNAARFEQSYQDIADTVRISGRDDPQANTLELVRDWMQSESNGKWFLILDNLDHAEFLSKPSSAGQAPITGSLDISHSQPLFSYLPRSSNGSMLVTTRSMTVALHLTGAVNVIRVQEMNSEQALSLLRHKLAHSQGQSEHDAELVQVLECIPLAIVQAAAYISLSSPPCTVKQYLENFGRRIDSDLFKSYNQSADLRRDLESENSIILTWRLSFEHIRQARPSASDLLSFLSFFDPHGISDAVIQELVETSNLYASGNTVRNSSDDLFGVSNSEEDNERESQLGRDMRTLIDYSFISTRIGGHKFEMHSLVQRAVRAWLNSQGLFERWKQTYVQSLSDNFPNGEFENWEMCSSLFPHAKAAMNQQPTGGEYMRKWATLLYNASWFAWRRGAIADAEEMSVTSMKTRKNLLGPGHLETLSSMSMVAVVYNFTGQLAEAEELGLYVMKRRTSELGPDHPSTISSMASLASTYKNQGRWMETEELQTNVLEMREKILGLEHPDTLISMSDVASTLSIQGRWSEAEERQLRVLDMSQKILGPEHPDTLTTMANLASTFWHQGRWADAEKLEIQVIDIRKRIQGAEHPSTLSNMANLVTTYSKQGKWNEAEVLNLKVTQIFERILGAEHPSTLTNTANLVSIYRNQGKWDKAQELGARVVESFAKILGKEHPSTLTCMANLASTYRNQGQWEAAKALQVEVVESRTRILGPKHPATLAASANLTIILEGLGQK